MGSLFPNYLLEFTMLLPAAIMALMPLRGHFRFRMTLVCAAAILCVAVCVVLGAFVAFTLDVPSNYILLPCCLILLGPLLFVSTRGRAKTIFSFVNAVMLTSFSTLYASVMTIPWEIGNEAQVFTVQSGFVSVVVGFVVSVLFARTLLVKLPGIFDTDSLDNVWKWAALLSVAITAFVIWMMPINVTNLMPDLVRPKTLALALFVPVSVWIVYHAAWMVALRTLEGERLKRENELLAMEEKRHGELMSFIDDARAMRHDFRHHMVVVGELAHAGKAEEAAAYADQFVESSRKAQTSFYCENRVVDAVAAHYDAMAKSREVSVRWTLDLPRELPVKEVDFCSVLGNLVENAIVAARNCEEGRRNASVKASVFSGSAITLVVENGFTGTVRIAENGFPLSDREAHGIGLSSVAAIARKYDGALTVSTEGSTFVATVVLHASG